MSMEAGPTKGILERSVVQSKETPDQEQTTNPI